MARLGRTADDIRARVPAVLESWQFMRDHVLHDGVVERPLKELCFRYVADPDAVELDDFHGRERLALEWARAIVWDSDLADDALWEQLHAQFSERELVELGCSIGFVLGQQHWERTLGLPPTAGLESV